MPRIRVRAIRPEADVDALAGLLAARHKRDRTRLPQYPEAFESAATCAALVRETFARPEWVNGAMAEADGVPVGYMVGTQQLHAPTSVAAQWIEPHSISIGMPSHAADPEHDVVAVYRALYEHLAGLWARQGYFIHSADIPAGDADVQEAFVSLGFGRKTVCAVRSTAEPVEARAADPKIEVHQASSEDLEVVMHLEDTNNLHHLASPIFWPYLKETHAATREYVAGLLADPGNAHLVAYRDGKPIGMDTFNPPNFVSPMVQGGRTTYLFQGVVEPEARGGGIGTVLLAKGIDWARAEGYEYCALHFASANTSGGPFWLNQGFVPVENTMLRHVDERVAWARP